MDHDALRQNMEFILDQLLDEPYEAAGWRVQTLLTGAQPAGAGEVIWHGSDE